MDSHQIKESEGKGNSLIGKIIEVDLKKEKEKFSFQDLKRFVRLKYEPLKLRHEWYLQINCHYTPSLQRETLSEVLKGMSLHRHLDRKFE
jgi:hypothetical protein